MNPSILTDPALTLTDAQAYVIDRVKCESSAWRSRTVGGM